MEFSRTTIIGAACVLVTLASFTLFALGNLTLEQATGAATIFIGILVGIGFKLTQDQTPKCIAIFLLVSFAMSQTSCGANSFKNALEASKDLGANTDAATERVRNIWQQGAISLEQKDHIARLLIKIAKAGKQGHEVLVALSQQYAKPSDVPVDKWFDVDKAFSDEVVIPFLELLTVIAGLNSETSAYLRIAISQVRNMILILSKLLGKQQSLIERINCIEGGDVYA
jgi:hypothetical protein